MSSISSGVERTLVELGYVAHEVLFFSDFYWLEAAGGAPEPSRIASAVNDIRFALNQLRDEIADDQTTSALDSVGESLQQAFGSFRALWQSSERQRLVQERDGIFQEDLSEEWFDEKSMGNRRTWRGFQLALSRLQRLLPDLQARFVQVGSLFSQVSKLGTVEDEQELQVGDRWPILSLQAGLIELRNQVPALHGLNVELSQAAMQQQQSGYRECVQAAAAVIYRMLLERLGAAQAPGGEGPPTEEASNQTPAQAQAQHSVFAASFSQGRSGDEAAQPAGRPPLPLEIERWEDLGIGITENRDYLAITPCPQDGEIVAMRTTVSLHLPGRQWLSLLELLARSENGNRAQKCDVMHEFQYSLVGRVAAADAHELRVVGVANNRLTPAIADLGRRLRRQVRARNPGSDSVLSIAQRQFVTSRFVVRHLLRDDNGRLRFGNRNG